MFHLVSWKWLGGCPPEAGPFDTKLQDRCPVVPYNIALQLNQLIQEIDDLTKIALKAPRHLMILGFNDSAVWSTNITSKSR